MFEQANDGPAKESAEQNKGYVATAVIVNDKGELLLIKRGRNPHKGEWSLISGIGASIEGLDPVMGVAVEVSGDLKVKIEGITPLIIVPIEDDDRSDRNIGFVCRIKEGQKLNPDTRFVLDGEYEWVRDDDARLKHLPFEQSEIVEAYMESI